MTALQELRQVRTNRIKDAADEIINYMIKNKYTSTRRETCSSAPAFGWSVEEYNDMPAIADELRKQGLTVTSQVNHGVTDWNISI